MGEPDLEIIKIIDLMNISFNKIIDYMKYIKKWDNHDLFVHYLRYYPEVFKTPVIPLIKKASLTIDVLNEIDKPKHKGSLSKLIKVFIKTIEEDRKKTIKTL